MYRSVIALLLVLGMLVAAAIAHGGYKLGGFDAFTWARFLHGTLTMSEYALGYPVISVWWAVLIPALVILAPGLGVTRIAFHRLAILGFPLSLVVLHADNVQHPRYYLLAGIALLILLAEMIGQGIRAGGWRRWLGAAALLAILGGGLVQDIDLAINRRGDTAAAIRAMQARTPSGARVYIDRDLARAVLEAGAAQARYPLTILARGCPEARFFFADRFHGETVPSAIRWCNRDYLPLAEGRAHGLSGTNWTLYEQRP